VPPGDWLVFLIIFRACILSSCSHFRAVGQILSIISHRRSLPYITDADVGPMRFQSIILPALEIFRISLIELDCGDAYEMYLDLQNICISLKRDSLLEYISPCWRYNARVIIARLPHADNQLRKENTIIQSGPDCSPSTQFKQPTRPSYDHYYTSSPS